VFLSFSPKRDSGRASRGALSSLKIFLDNETVSYYYYKSYRINKV